MNLIILKCYFRESLSQLERDLIRKYSFPCINLEGSLTFLISYEKKYLDAEFKYLTYK